MSVIIRDLVHDADHQAVLFSLIGELALSRVVHQALGTCPTSEPGRVWCVATDTETRATLGFVSLHLLATGHRGQVKHLYASDGPPAVGVLRRLLKAIAGQAKTRGLRTLTAIDRTAAARLYESHGWTAAAERGHYSTYTLELQDD
ncbi:hypothetical protein [uncultured Thiodictyon sp.]|uniref:GNAT family N-acetyltransferase n=1 Tax=uncultured Thiodictyon sp. TaxID=1846217 RepID=UPI0025EE1446|nr:hypothetical protein [uncultured Thiodictyon sp.]